MIRVEREQIINYIKDNSDICLAFTNIELNLDTRNETLNGDVIFIPYIEATIKIDYDRFVKYIMNKKGD